MKRPGVGLLENFVSAQALRIKMLKWAALVFSPILAITWLILLFTDQWSYSEPERLAADPAITTPRLDGVVDALRDDPVYVDPLLAGSDAADLVDDQVRAAIERSPEQIRLIVMAVDPGDDTGGQGAVHLARIVEHLDQPGVYVLITQGRLPALQVLDDEVDRMYLHPGQFTDRAALLELIDEIPAEMEQRRETKTTNPWLIQALLVGVALSVLLWYLVLLVRLATRRNRSYLAGFDR
ncbi:hypothetical protein [Nocardioides sp. AE5]|uniref:hypothetical protein n=1 Tax=Nocardioides sp. AE5 TaxID=2962573 RepID=UPI00288157A1|nr:hypothetical protein [Nocardioides sp. AE5]MDT0203962.1 hypothetical protein [Nocardioides sp. AE5]